MAASAYTWSPRSYGRWQWVADSRGVNLGGLLPNSTQFWGMHAITFADVEAQRIVVAFRGTDLDRSTLSGMADHCANVLLSGTHFSNLPPECSRFTAAGLQYLERAREYVQTTEDSFRGWPLLLTGHSLGAELALLVSAHRAAGVLPVVAFSAPGVGTKLPHRSALSDVLDRLVIIGDEWDPVMRSSRAHWLGSYCQLRSAATANCSACQAAAFDYALSDCAACFYQKHLFKHVLQAMASPHAAVNCSAFLLPRPRTPLEPPKDKQPPSDEDSFPIYFLMMPLALLALLGMGLCRRTPPPVRRRPSPRRRRRGRSGSDAGMRTSLRPLGSLSSSSTARLPTVPEDSPITLPVPAEV
eukprot:PLAT16128.2.p1 GENE.PLAT16128.2~~PLAT16128.2.p1  ORF type:complete len:356 (-),score=78.38 PLAT16128.2:74-1141(-)